MKNLFLILGLVSLTSLVTAQIGVKGGATFSSIADAPEEVEEENIRVGFHAGLMVDIPVADFFSIRPEFMYTRKGAKYETFDTEIKSRLDYIDIPVLAVLKPLGGPFQAYIGPQFSYLTAVKYEFYNNTFNEEGVIEDDRDDFETWDLGLSIGAGLQFDKVLFDIRYTRGLRNLEKANSLGGIEFSDPAKNYNLQASLGFFF
jgi:hypothetical protein